MNKGSRRIDEKNFVVFQKLIEGVFFKATGKSLEKTSEQNCDDIVNKIKVRLGIPENKKFLSGKSLENYINAVLSADYNKYKINPQFKTLNNLAEYITEDFDKQEKSHKEKNDAWIGFQKKYGDLILQESPGSAVAMIDATIVPVPGKTSKINPDSDFSNTKLADDTPVTDRKKFIRAGIWGGLYSGVAASFIISLVRYINGHNVTPLSTGYENVGFEKFMRYIFAPLLLFQVLAGALIGWLCCYIAYSKGKFLNKFLLFIISFTVAVVLRQSMTRDAWYAPGTYPNHDENGNLRMGGGLLGEPDFETLAMGLIGAVLIMTVGQTLRRNRVALLTTKKIVWLIATNVFYGIISWCMVYGIYLLLTVRLKIIKTGDYLIAPSFFRVDFPHWERPIFVISLCLIYTLILVLFIQCRFRKIET